MRALRLAYLEKVVKRSAARSGVFLRTELWCVFKQDSRRIRELPWEMRQRFTIGTKLRFAR
jgi:hypothetical protein